MRRLFVLSALVLGTLAWHQPAHASACSMDRYMHNGSVMDVQICDGGVLTISYAQPRRFSARCGVVPYAVSGARQGINIVLYGTAPIRGQGCNVVRQQQDTLVFTPVSGGGPGVVAPQCPPGFVLSGGQCIRGGGGGAAPSPGGGDWHAIAGSFGKQGQAHTRAGQLGGGAWYVMNTAQCTNFRNGYWIATAGPFSKAQAQAYANAANHYGAYIKTCH